MSCGAFDSHVLSTARQHGIHHVSEETLALLSHAVEVSDNGGKQLQTTEAAK